MKKESRQRVLAFMDWGMQKLAFKDWDEGLRFATVVFEAVLEKIRLIDTREKFDALMADVPEPTEVELEEGLEVARGLFYKFRPQILRFAKGLPHSPGGQPRSFRVSQLDEIRESILSLQRKRVLLREAFERVAQQQSVGRRKPVSARTIERIWQSRRRENVANEQ